MAKTVRSRKQKGGRLQKEVRELLLEAAPQLEPDDIKTALASEQGEDLKLSPAARKVYPYSIECKNQEKASIWAWLKQAHENTKEGCEPALVFRRNNTEAHVVLRLEHFIELLKNSH